GADDERAPGMSADRPPLTYAPVDPAAPPAVTIVTPVHDGATALRALAVCLAGQSLQQWEWVIVDDGTASAASVAWLDAARGRDARIRILELAVPGERAAALAAGRAAARAAHGLGLGPTHAPAAAAPQTRVWRPAAGGTENGAPHVAASAAVRDDLPFDNRLAKTKPHLLLVVPWLDAGGAEKFNLDLLAQLMGRGFQCTIATTLVGL